jgi:hypothetical protein
VTEGWTYQKAGVNVDLANTTVEKIKTLVKSTRRPEVITDIGGFSGVFCMGEKGGSHPCLVASTDGVGTKLKIAIHLGVHDSIGIDLVAMCVNDILCTGATRNNTELVCSDEFMDGLINKGASFGWYFTYVPIGKKPDMNLMPTPEQRLHLRNQVHHLRYDKPVFIGDFWNDGPYVGGCLAGGRRYFHINNAGDVEPCVFCHFTVDNIKNKSLKEVFSSPFFRAIQENQPYDNNLMRPCMLIDVPEVLRDVVEKYGARPSHEGADSLVKDLKEDIDKYSQAFKDLSDPYWEENYKGTIYYKDYKTERKEYLEKLKETPVPKSHKEKAKV